MGKHYCDVVCSQVDRLWDRPTQAWKADSRPEGWGILGFGYSECGLEVGGVGFGGHFFLTLGILICLSGGLGTQLLRAFKHILSVYGHVLGIRVSCSQDTANPGRETTAPRGNMKSCGSPNEQVICSSS